MEEKLKFVQHLINKGMKVEEELDGQHFREKWEERFAAGIDDKTKKDIYFNRFLWHIFSFGALKCLEKDEAEAAFDQMEKKNCYLFSQHHIVSFELLNAESLKVEDLGEETDIYVVDEDFTWTFVKTHESVCGPYFYQLP
ncbi:DUF4275 family protein [Chungangia koreensis]